MSVITTAIQPNGVVRIFFDLRPATPDWQDERLIARTMEHAVSHDGGLTPQDPHATDAAPWHSRQQPFSTQSPSASVTKRRR